MWMLHEVLGNAFEVQRVDLYSAAQYSPDFLLLNPNHSVPVLQITWANGTVQHQTESAAMVAFLADAFPDAALAPPITASLERATYLQMLHFSSHWIDMMLWQIRAHEHVLPAAQQDSRTAVRYRHKFQKEVEPQLRKIFERGAFACGDSFSAADCVLGHTVFWARGYGLCQDDVFKEYVSRLSKRAAFKMAFSDTQEFVLDARAYPLSQHFTG
jgi:glutathione S-transferase